MVEAERADDVPRAVEDSIAAGGVRVVLVRTDRTANVTRHREVWSALDAGLASPKMQPASTQVYTQPASEAGIGELR